MPPPSPASGPTPAESLIEYPSSFPVKVMGTKADGFLEAVILHVRNQITD